MNAPRRMLNGNIFKQVFNLVDNFSPDAEAEARAKAKWEAARKRKEAKEVRE